MAAVTAVSPLTINSKVDFIFVSLMLPPEQFISICRGNFRCMQVNRMRLIASVSLVIGTGTNMILREQGTFLRECQSQLWSTLKIQHHGQRL